MDITSEHDLKRLEEQIFLYKPSIKSAEKKKYVSDRLQNQLLHSKAVVRIQRMDADCESLMISLKQRLLLLQDFLITKNKQLCTAQEQEALKNEEEELKLSLSSESSDDESLSVLLAKKKSEERQNSMSLAVKEKAEKRNAVNSEKSNTFTPLALRRQPRERRCSYKSYSSSSTSHSRINRKKFCHKREKTVTTSSVTFSSEEILEEQETNTTPTLHIKIPSLHRGDVHYIILDSLNFARKIFDYRANEAVTEQNQQISICHSSKTSKSRRNTLKGSSAPALQQLNQEEQELGLSQLIQDVMNEACSDETLQATSALENINNNLIDNYDLIENDSIIKFSQTSEEFNFSQNSTNVTVDTACNTSKSTNKSKKGRKNTKRSNEFKHTEPPKKRGRKPKQRNDLDTTQSQPPTKSSLAEYVELFSNDCELMPGSTTPAASSTKSQHLVSSTTHNFEIVDQIQQQQESQGITYYIDGDWANGGPCQLVSSNSLVVEELPSNTNDDAPFEGFVNYNIDNSGNSANNVVTTVFDCNHSLPVSIPRSIANIAFQNKTLDRQVTHQIHNQSTAQNALLPVINIQIPPLPNNICSDEPPPAHTHKEVVDLSVKSKSKVNFSSETLKNDDCKPLDLSTCGKNAKEKTAENNFVTIDCQDEEFIRHLIEQNHFEFEPDGIPKENDISVFQNDNSQSFKAALDMPLLEFDATELDRLVGNTENTNTQELNILTGNNICNDSTNNAVDSNYVSMEAINSSSENDLRFTDQSTREIFDKLLDISPANNFLDDALNESVFDQCGIENSTMFDGENSTTQKVEEKGICNSNSDKDNKETGNNTSSVRTSSCISSAVDIYNSNSAMDKPLNLKSSNEKDSNESKVNSRGLTTDEINNDVFSNTIECVTTNEKQFDAEYANVMETTFDETVNKAEIIAKDNEIVGETIKNNVNIENSSSSSLSVNNEMANNRTGDIQQTVQKNDCAQHALNKAPERYKENVVFSVAKTTLNEYDNLYATDSDVSSIRSCDLTERKSVEKEKKSFTDSTNSVNKNFNVSKNLEEDCQNVETNVKDEVDFNIYNNLEEKCQDVETKSKDEVDFNMYNNLEEKCQDAETNSKDKVAETSINLQNNQVPMSQPEDILCIDTSYQNLTLLELDSKLEDPLDFNEDLDDALSLTTSCFGSPADDHFMDSIVDIDTKDTSVMSPEVKEPIIEPNTSKFKDLKHFKITKFNNPTDLSSKQIINQPEPVEINFSKLLPTKSAKRPTVTHNAEIITRTVKNDLVSNLQDADKMLPVRDFLNEPTIEENIILRVFGISCLPYLVDKCVAATDCQLSHQFNDAEKVYQSLNTLNKIHVNVAYRILYNHSKLFEVYFNIFCAYYTNKNDRKKLLNMVNDCERLPKYAEFIIVIYESLFKCGLNSVNACRLILKRIRETSMSKPIVEALVAIIMKSDWTMFTDYIEKYTQDMYQFNFHIDILEQMAPAVLNSKTSHLKHVFGKCVQTLHCDEMALLLNSPALLQCVALLNTNT